MFYPTLNLKHETENSMSNSRQNANIAFSSPPFDHTISLMSLNILNMASHHLRLMSWRKPRKEREKWQMIKNISVLKNMAESIKDNCEHEKLTDLNWILNKLEIQEIQISQTSCQICKIEHEAVLH